MPWFIPRFARRCEKAPTLLLAPGGRTDLVQRPAVARRIEAGGVRGEDLGGPAVRQPRPPGELADVTGCGPVSSATAGQEDRTAASAGQQPVEQIRRRRGPRERRRALGSAPRTPAPEVQL